MKIPYEKRQLGQFYYCSLCNKKYQYIFQCNDLSLDVKRFPCIYNSGNGWNGINTDNNFKIDWQSGKDEEMRLATPEEIALIKEKDVKGLLIETISQYEIY